VVLSNPVHVNENGLTSFSYAFNSVKKVDTEGVLWKKIDSDPTGGKHRTSRENQELLSRPWRGAAGPSEPCRKAENLTGVYLHG
jgi:hypothetical protein